MKTTPAASFSRRVKEELSHIRAPRECCRRTEMVGMVRSAGTLHILPGGRYALEVEAPDAGVARAVYSSLSVLGAAPEVRQYAPGRARPHERYIVRVESGDRSLFSRAGALAADGLPATGVPRGVFERRCCAGAYLRAAFIVHGTVSPPRRAAHLELRAPDAVTAGGLTRLGAMVGAHLRVRDHRGHAVYTKDLASVGALLAAMGAHQGCLEWEAGGVWATVRNEANRLANCDQANVRRTVKASVEHRDAIRRLDKGGRLDKLPAVLRDAARVRLEHPDASLDELAKELGISKSAVADRLRRLVSLAGEAEFEPPGRRY